MLGADTHPHTDRARIHPDAPKLRRGRTIAIYDYSVDTKTLLPSDTKSFLDRGTAQRALSMALGPKFECDANDSAIHAFNEYRDIVGLADPLQPAMDPLERGFGRLFDFACWLQHSRTHLSPEGISQYVSTVRAFLARRNLNYIRHSLLTSLVKRLRQSPAHQTPKHRDPAPPQMIVSIYANDTISLGVRTAIVIAFNGLLRPCSYCIPRKWKSRPSRTLLLQDLRLFKGHICEGFTLPIKKERADKFNLDNIQHYLRDDINPICPVRAMQRYLAEYHRFLQPECPLFIDHVSHTGRITYVTSSAVSKALQAAAPQFGMNPEYISSQSLRITGAYNMADSEAKRDLIQQRGRWAGGQYSDIVLMYERTSEPRMVQTAISLRPRDSYPLCTH